MNSKQYTRQGQLCLVVLFLFYLLQTFCHRILFGDGAHILFLSILKQQTIYFEVARESTRFWTSLPMVLATYFPTSSITDLYSWLFSLGIYGIQFLCYWGCFRLLPESKKSLFIFPACQWMFGVVLNSGLPIIEIHIVLSLFWFLVFFLHFGELNNLPNKLLILFLGVCLIKSHELIAGLGLVLGYLSYDRAKGESAKEAAVLKVFSGLAVIAAIVSAYYIVYPTDPFSRDGFFKLFFSFSFARTFQGDFNYLVLLSMLSSGTLLLIVLSNQIRFLGRASRTLGSLNIIGSLIVLFQFLFVDEFYNFSEEILSRVWSAVSVGPIFLAYYFGRQNWVQHRWGTSLFFSGMVLILIQSWWGIEYHQYIEQRRILTTRCVGHLEASRIEKEIQPASLYRFYDNWTAPEMTALLSPNFEVQGLFSDEGPAHQKVIRRLLEHSDDGKGHFKTGKYLKALLEEKSECSPI